MQGELHYGTLRLNPRSTSLSPTFERLLCAGLSMLPVSRNTLIILSSSSLRNLRADGIPISVANCLSSVAYQYPFSNCVRVIEVASTSYK